MDSDKYAEFTAAALASAGVGRSFTAYDDVLSGTIVELVPYAKIVQLCRGSDEGWVTGHYSTAPFTLELVDSGTRLTFVHTGVRW